ncbi:tetratricopeptide repeat protein [Kribbella qitaiheensis]|uniref:Tetratricopeptide repeat protein n=1 Tax=Kribbella qitaiheensis TaxID=1544730 RepID=A0A7G6X127_9ACTN|nr:BTAD domain-containing putative transcriptional regulator [Kribbella qitaiheensis]QNE19942.1 tetratricopeptide repeat protein [Kribbella qitaiheensis]
MYFEVLGELLVRTETGDPITVPDTKVRTLLLNLLVNLGRPVSADRLIDALWGDHPPRNARGTLQARISQLRTALARAEPGARALVAHGPAGYTLQVSPEVVDSNKFELLVTNAQATRDLSERIACLTEALELWRGPAYADVADEEFARAARNRLEEQRLAAWEERAEARLELGEHAELVGELAELTARHPLRERLRSTQLKALYRSGQQEAALTAYAELREALAEQLGADPGRELAALHQAILRHDPVLSGRPKTNLPTPLNELIGREKSLAQGNELLCAARLVTLVGPGGVGKTRLALEIGRDQSTEVRLVELAVVRAPDVLDAIAATVGLRDDESGELADRLAESLAARPVLLVLDNCEHVVERVADLVRRLLAAAAGLRVLATSREPLGLAGEHLLEVEPLEPPEAARLFLERAAAATPGFANDPEAVAAICRRLDGIPLALELAATRVRALGVQELAARLDDRFRLLAGGRGVPERQRTLRATIDWSWDLLAEQERVMLRRLAVYADGFTLDAAGEVSDLPADELLGKLVDRSLVVATAGRYRLLESVAAYSLERLAEAGEETRLRRRHAAYYVALAERAEPRLRGREQQVWLGRLDQESANLRTALDHAARTEATELALRLVNACSWYWYLRGRLGEARRSLTTALGLPNPSPMLQAEATAWSAGMAATAADSANLTDASERALALYRDVDDPRGQARAEWFLTATQWAYGDPGLLLQRVDRAIESMTEHGDRWGLAAALSTRAQLALTHADLDAMQQDGLRSLGIFDELGDGWGRQQANYSLIVAAEITGDYETATRRLTESARLAEDLGMWTEVSLRTAGLGRMALLAGDYTRADELHEKARRLAIEQSNKSAEEYAEVGLGLSARRQGDLDKAERHFTNWLGWLQQVGGTAGTAFILAQLGFIAEQRGEYERALELQQQGYATAKSFGDERAIALALEGLAGAKAGAGLSHEAVVLLAEAEALRRAVGAPLPPGERFDVDRITFRASRRPWPGCP